MTSNNSMQTDGRFAAAADAGRYNCVQHLSISKGGFHVLSFISK